MLRGGAMGLTRSCASWWEHLGNEKRSFGLVQRVMYSWHYPFNPDMTTPSMKYCWKKKKTNKTGSVIKSAIAIIS